MACQRQHWKKHKAQCSAHTGDPPTATQSSRPGKPSRLPLLDSNSLTVVCDYLLGSEHVGLRHVCRSLHRSAGDPRTWRVASLDEISGPGVRSLLSAAREILQQLELELPYDLDRTRLVADVFSCPQLAALCVPQWQHWL